MKNNIKIFGYLAIIVLLAACSDDFFELKSKRERRLQTIADVDQAVNGVYYALVGNDGGKGTFEVLPAFSALVGREGYIVDKTANTGDYIDFYNRNNSVDLAYTNRAYFCLYSAIGNCNTWLSEMRDDLGITKDAAYKHYQGELHFLRAYSYWMLLKFFCPPYEKGGANDARIVPMITNPVLTIGDTYTQPGSVQELYNLVIADLDTAKLMMKKQQSAGRAGKYSAWAMQARVYFQLGNTDKALEACDTVVRYSSYRLNESTDVVFKKDYAGGANEEIFSFSVGQATYNNGLGGASSNWNVPRKYSIFNFMLPSSNDNIPGTGISGISASNRSISASFTMLQQVGWIDADHVPTPEALGDIRFSDLLYAIDGQDPTWPEVIGKYYWVNKYYRGPQDNNRWRIGAIPLIRLGEIYATRALLEFKKGDTQAALADINSLRRRAGASVLGSLTEDDIHNERWREMFFEGDYLFYLQALQKDIPSNDGPGTSVPYNDKSLYWPIPQSEYEYNPELTK